MRKAEYEAFYQQDILITVEALEQQLGHEMDPEKWQEMERFVNRYYVGDGEHDLLNPAETDKRSLQLKTTLLVGAMTVAVNDGEYVEQFFRWTPEKEKELVDKWMMKL